MRVVYGLIFSFLIAASVEGQSLRSMGSQVAGTTGGVRDTYLASEAFDLTIRNPGPVEIRSHELDTLVIEYVDPRYWYRDDPIQSDGLVRVEATEAWFFNRFRPAMMPGAGRKLRLTVPQRFLRTLRVEQSDNVTITDFHDPSSFPKMKVELYMAEIYGSVNVSDVTLPAGLVLLAPVVHTKLKVERLSGKLDLRVGSVDVNMSESRDVDVDIRSEHMDLEMNDCSGVFSLVSHTGDLSLDHVKGSALIDIESDADIFGQYLLGDFRVLAPVGEVAVAAHSEGLLHIQGVSDDRLSLGQVSQGVIDFDPSSTSCPAKLRRARAMVSAQ